ncbi:MAG: PAS domain S-box protein [Pseudomonadota bacterium]|nr:PAS domain S-box protein [Pseudomonadota bacterium]
MPIIHPPAAPTHLGLIRSFITIFAPICLVFLIIGAMHYYTFYTTERSAIESTESLNVDLANRMIMEEIAGVVKDLRFLAEHIESRGLPDALSWSRERGIADEFRIFAGNKGLYDQIRYLDKNGMEIVRVNYHGGDPEIVPFADLQNKSNRYYFREALALERGGIYLSRFDLNVENEKIEQPFKPVIRFGIPVFDHNGSKGGIVLLNYLGARLIENFTRAAANIADHIELVNSSGYWLSSPNPEDEWGFMLERDIRFQNSNPDAWKKILHHRNGQFETLQGLFTFSTIYPLSAALAVNPAADKVPTGNLKEDAQWKIISHISASEISFTLPQFLRNNAALYLSMFGLVFFGAGLLARTWHLRHIAEAQRDYEQHFRQTMENINLAAVAVNRDGRITFCNNYFLRITGWQRDEVIGRDWVEQFVSQESKREISSIIPLMDDPEQFPSQLEFQVKTHNGEPRLISWNNTPSFDSKGDVIGVTGIGKDITDIRRTEANLLKLSQAVEQSPSTVMITDTRGKIEYVNPKFTQVSGYDAHEVIGKNPRMLKSGETTAHEYSDLWQTVKNGGEWRGEFHNRRKNSELYWESAAISAIRNSDGEIINFLALKEDITEKKRMEAEIESQNRELAHSESMAVMGRMASMIAHDLRNPLSSVKMTLQILEKKAGKEIGVNTRELCQISLEQTRYMEEILSDMLSYSRPDALKPEWISIDKVIDMAISLSQRRQEEKKVKLHTDYQPGLPTLYADATKLRQVFSNLIANAQQATGESDNPRVNIEAMVELGLEGTSIRIDICDNGCGINDADRDNIFEPFYTTRAKGTGLGLAIVKRILDQHKATISISDNVPKGSCISVILPVSPASEITPQRAQGE